MPIHAVQGEPALRKAGGIRQGMATEARRHRENTGRREKIAARLLGGGKFSGGFQNLAGEVICYFGVVAGFGEIGGTEQLLFAVAEHVSDVLLHLWIVEFALACRLLGNELQDDVARSAEGKRAADFAGLHRENNFPEGWIGFVECGLGLKAEIAAGR
jgi:hypothetical protein